MTHDEIIDMAEKAGLASGSDEYPDIWQTYMYVGKKEIEAFAKLIAEAEREACAKVCDELIAPDIYRDTDVSMWDVTCMDCAAAIRARGQA